MLTCCVCLLISAWLLSAACSSQKQQGGSICTSRKKCTKLSFVSGPLHVLFSAQCASPVFSSLTTPGFPSGLSVGAAPSGKPFLIPPTPPWLGAPHHAPPGFCTDPSRTFLTLYYNSYTNNVVTEIKVVCFLNCISYLTASSVRAGTLPALFLQCPGIEEIINIFGMNKR